MHWKIRTATRTDIPEMSALLACAFDANATMQWMLPDDATRRERLATMFATMLRWQYLPLKATDIAASDAIIGAGAAWCPPHAWRVPTWRQLLSGPGMFRALGDRARAGQTVSQTLEHHHPREPHWYLACIGTDPEAQGQGAASALLRHRLAQFDGIGQAAYLEALEEHVPIYERFGFRATQQIVIPAGALPQWGMWRDPQPAE